VDSLAIFGLLFASHVALGPFPCYAVHGLQPNDTLPVEKGMLFQVRARLFDFLPEIVGHLLHESGSTFWLILPLLHILEKFGDLPVLLLGSCRVHHGALFT
jgi:hypothetical protein